MADTAGTGAEAAAGGDAAGKADTAAAGLAARAAVLRIRDEAAGAAAESGAVCVRLVPMTDQRDLSPRAPQGVRRRYPEHLARNRLGTIVHDLAGPVHRSDQTRKTLQPVLPGVIRAIVSEVLMSER
ncbi:hypothetical protein GCM10010177_62860 [Actinomadura citrea]|nr:hypothetical protein GCM10010177_62860 [Actinomadura citrea]